MREAVTLGLAVTGLAFSLSGAVGIVRMPDLYTRLQCSSKNVTMGALPLLVAVIVDKGAFTPYGSRALVVAALVFVVNPMAAHALARAAYGMGVPMWRGSVVDQARPGGSER